MYLRKSIYVEKDLRQYSVLPYLAVSQHKFAYTGTSHQLPSS